MEAIQSFTKKHKHYPELLKHSYDPPRRLYRLGEIPYGKFVAVVGTRRPTSYGREVTYRLVCELVRTGFDIISGLAYGVDTIAHQATLDSGGRTIAVLGCGLDVLYPSQNRLLAQAIIERGGALLSEYPPGTPPLKHHFPARNRIIAGLSEGIVIPEADVRSGSLITARLALEAGRTVMAVPGSILSQRSDGTNNLIKAGALAVTDVSDICVGLGYEPPLKVDQANQILPAGSAGNILQALAQSPLKTDALVESAAGDVAGVLAAIHTLEVTGYIRSLGGGAWVRLK